MTRAARANCLWDKKSSPYPGFRIEPCRIRNFSKTELPLGAFCRSCAGRTLRRSMRHVQQTASPVFSGEEDFHGPFRLHREGAPDFLKALSGKLDRPGSFPKVPPRTSFFHLHAKAPGKPYSPYRGRLENLMPGLAGRLCQLASA